MNKESAKQGGDFTDKLNTIIYGSNVDILKTFPDECIDLTVTSPPYDCIRNYNKKLDTEQDIIGKYAFSFEELANQLFRVTKMGGVIVWVVGDQAVEGKISGTTETGNSFRQALYFQQIGFNIHDTMIYKKPGVRYPDQTRYHQTFEYMFILSKGKPKSINFIKDKKNLSYDPNKRWGVKRLKREKNDDGFECDSFHYAVEEFGRRHNVWEINVEQSTGRNINEFNWHPAVFPSNLAHDHIISWSNEGDVVLDPFSGSGTTAIQAKITKRKYIGIDINEEYVLKSKKIIENYNVLDNSIKDKNGILTNFIQF